MSSELKRGVEEDSEAMVTVMCDIELVASVLQLQLLGSVTRWRGVFVSQGAYR